MPQETWTPAQYQAYLQHGEVTISALPQAEAEKPFQARICRLAKAHGWLLYHTFDARRSPEGFPDLVLVRPGELIFAELKTATGKTTQPQETWLALLRTVPQLEIHLWRPGDWSHIAARLTQPAKASHEPF